MRWWSRTRGGLLLLAAVVLSSAGCGSSARMEAGRGLYWNWSEEMLAERGYPGQEDNYSSNQWGVLYDEAGIAYGPRSFYEGRTRLEHPYLTVTDEYLESRWVRLYQSGCCTEALLGHYLEILDLAFKDLTEKLEFTPDRKLMVVPTADLEEYLRWTGRGFWVTHVVQGESIVLSPVDVLFRRTLAAHAAFAAVGQSLLDLQTHGRLPMWFREGLSSYLAEEGYEHLSFMGPYRGKREVLQHPVRTAQHVYPLVDLEEGRIARYNAFLMVWHLSESYGWNRIVELLAVVADGARFEEAVREIYGLEYGAWLRAIDPVRRGEPTTTMPPR